MKALHIGGLPPEVMYDNVAFIHAVRAGVSGQVVREAVALLGGHNELIADLAGTTPGNLHRTYKKAVLAKTQSEAILDLLRLFAYAATIFDNEDIVRSWFDCEIPALSGTRPIDIMDTFQGRTMVRDILVKIERGEFS